MIISTVVYLGYLYACDNALKWVRSRPKSRQSMRALWADCPRGDWMLWLASRVPGTDRKELKDASWACFHLEQAVWTCPISDNSMSNAEYTADAAYVESNWNTAVRDQMHRDCADMVRLLVKCPNPKELR